MLEAKSNSKNKEIEGKLYDTFPTLKKYEAKTDSPIDSERDEGKNLSAEKKECDHFEKKESFDLSISVDCCSITIGSRKKISINKDLFSFRVTQFLWFGAGILPTLFLGIFLKQRGLSLVELSSVFSLIFIFQFSSCFITGVITDKSGNAKPVLFFLMLFTSLALLLMSLIPNINSGPCFQVEQHLNLNNISLERRNFSSCYNSCLHEKKSIHETVKNYTEFFLFENSSLVEQSGLVKDSNSSACDHSSTSIENSSLLPSENVCCTMCSSKSKVGCINSRKGHLLIVYATLVLVFFAVSNTAYRFMDFTAVRVAAKNDSHYGKERIFATCGMLLTTLIVAFVLNIDKSSGSEINFGLVIQITSGLQFCAFIALLTTGVPILPPGTNLTKKAFVLLKDIDILTFILFVFVAGNGFAFNYTLHMLFLEAIKAPSIVVSLHSVAVIFYALPFLFISDWWLEKFGTHSLLVLGLLSYALNNAVYSYINNAWWSLVIDITMAFADNLFWVAVVVHCRNVAPVGFAATLNALTGAVHFGMGRSSGVFFGGMLMHYYGPREAYRVMAAIFFSTAVLYSIFIFTRRKWPPAMFTMNGKEISDAKCSKNTDIQDASSTTEVKSYE